MQNSNSNYRLEKAARISSVLVSLLVLTGSIINLFRPVYFEAAIALVSLPFFIWIQFFMNRHSRLHNPPGMQLMISALILISLFAGRFFNLYKNLPGFDKSQHFLYGMLFGVLGYILFYKLNPGQRENLSISPGSVAIFTTSFALVCLFGWELFEFVCDRLFNTNMQAWKQGLAHGLIDTMFDMVADISGSTLVSLVAVRMLRRDAAGFYKQYLAGFFVSRPDRLKETNDAPASELE